LAGGRTGFTMSLDFRAARLKRALHIPSADMIEIKRKIK
jgi:hypothetical protein